MSSTSEDNLEVIPYNDEMVQDHRSITNTSPRAEKADKLFDKTTLDAENAKIKGNEAVYCSICYLECSIPAVSLACECRNTFCTDCYKQYLQTKMNSFEVLNIPCPEQSCSQVLTSETIKLILDDSQYQKYQELVFKKITYKNLNQKFCPNIKCLKPLTIDANNSFTSCSCGTKVCNTCAESWHPEKPCLDIKDAEFELYAKENEIKFCQICKTAVVRVEGCLHITCCVCDYEWCWTCGKQYSSKHECAGEWLPGIPSKEVQKQENQRRKSKFGLTTIINYLIEIPVMVPMFIIGAIIYAVSWILVYYTATQKNRGQKLVCWKVIPVALFSFTVGPVLLIIMGPYLLKEHIRKQRQLRRFEALQLQALNVPMKTNGRWLKGNIKDFKYTEQAKPEQQEVVIEIPGRQ